MPSMRLYRSTDWDNFIHLDLQTGLGELPDSSPEAIARFRERWPRFLKSKYAWGDSGPTALGSQLWVLEGDNGEYMGHLWTTDQEDFFSGELTMFVTTVAVDERHRGQGFGRLLMQHAMKIGRDRGITRIGLGVAAVNVGATKLYEKLGFKITRHAMEAVLGQTSAPKEN